MVRFNTDSIKLRGNINWEQVKEKKYCAFGEYHEERDEEGRPCVNLSGQHIDDLTEHAAYKHRRRTIKYIDEDKECKFHDAFLAGSAIANGPPGCGKSYTINQLLMKESIPLSDTLVTAYTHAATQNLKHKSIKTALNLSSALWNEYKLDYNMLRNKKLVVLDEYTMLPPDEMFILYQAWKEFKFKFWAFGDHRQCTAPTKGWLYYRNNPQFMEMCGNTMVRMKYKPDIGRFDETLWRSVLLLQEKGKLDPAWKDDVIPPCFKHVTASNNKRHALNKGCFERWIAESGKQVVSVAGFKACEGLPVMVYKESLKKVNLFKTQVWTIEKIDSEQKIVTLSMDGEEQQIDFDSFRRLFDYSFATTVHKIQGVTIYDHFIIHEVDQMSLNVLYTAISRGVTRSKVHLVDVDWNKQYQLDQPRVGVRLKMEELVQAKMLGRIYRITCGNGQTYIGQTVQTLDERLAEHMRSPSNDRMRAALDESARIELIEEFYISTQKKLDSLEKDWIKRELQEKGNVLNVQHAVKSGEEKQAKATKTKKDKFAVKEEVRGSGGRWRIRTTLKGGEKIDERFSFKDSKERDTALAQANARATELRVLYY